MSKLEIRTREELTKAVNALETLHSAGAQSIRVKEVKEDSEVFQLPIYVAVVEFSHGTEIGAAYEPIEAIARVADDWVEAMKSYGTVGG